MQENGEEGSFRSEQQIVLIQGPFILVGKVHVHTHSVAQLCPTLCDPMDCSPPGSSVHGISQERILEWVAISSSRGSSQPRD